MGSRGFTLLELLIALAMLAVMSSLALPALWGRMEGAKLSSAARQIEAAVVSARASAQREGRALALVAVPGDDGLRLRLEAMRSSSGEEGADSPPPVHRNIGMLPARVMIDLRTHSEMESDDPSESRAAAFGPAPTDPDAEESVRLVVALPDGTLLATDELRVWVRGSAEPTMQAASAGEEPPHEGEALLIRINRWTGVCTIRRAPVRAAEDAEQALPAQIDPGGGAE